MAEALLQTPISSLSTTGSAINATTRTTQRFTFFNLETKAEMPSVFQSKELKLQDFKRVADSSEPHVPNDDWHHF